MTDQELLQAIQQIVSNEVQSALENKLAPIQNDITRVALRQENEVIPKVALIYENQLKISDEHKQINKFDQRIVKVEDEQFAIRETIRELKCAQ